MHIICQIILMLFVGIPIGWIWYEYIIEPGKSIREGLHDWFEDSADDL